MNKKTSIIFTVSFIVIIAIGFIVILFAPAAGQYAERIREKESGVDYLISGRGCNDYANVSDEKLRKFIEEELDCCVSKKRFKKKVLKKQKEYLSGKYQYSNCVPIRERVLEILNST